MISPNIKTKIVIIPVAIPVIALTLSLIPELFASFIAKVVVREEADKFTTLLPINMALSICVFSSISLSTREAFLFLSSANDLIRILFTVVKQVSADEKKAESASRISKITICRASLESKKNQVQS